MSFETWAVSELKNLGYEHTQDLLSFINSLDDDDAMLEECLCMFLDVKNPKHKEFKNKLILQFKGKRSSSLPAGFYKKNDLDDTADSVSKISENMSTINQCKKKSKFVSLHSNNIVKNDVILVPRRLKCDCQASKHRLINNCMKCGRIVCEQEGSGPCVFCKNLVLTKGEKEIIDKGSKKSSALQHKLMNSKVIDLEAERRAYPLSLLKAIEHKNKLIEFDKSGEKRTKIFDDESDYFQSNSKWINPANKEELMKYEERIKAKKYDRNNKKYAIDVLGRKLTEETPLTVSPFDDPILLKLLHEKDPKYYQLDINCQALNLRRPQYVNEIVDSGVNNNGFYSLGELGRIQDKQLREMKDDGICLSLHQPWASLLIAGIKVHEGRNWYHSHRGRLWIASAAEVPNTSDISEIEEKYSKSRRHPKFPLNYPTSCLLGCVDLVDVLPHEEYQSQFPHGLSEFSYVFICENPRETSVKIPIKGQHKLFKLDTKLHETALKSLKVY